jgi:hexosaminidase
MKKSMLLLAVFLSSLNALLAQKLDIIPKPVKIEQKEEVFVIPSSVQIIFDKKLQKSTDYIVSNFLKNTGIVPIVSIGNKHKKNAIVFLVDEKIDIPNDGYELIVTKKGVRLKGKSPNGVLNGF